MVANVQNRLLITLPSNLYLGLWKSSYVSLWRDLGSDGNFCVNIVLQRSVFCCRLMYLTCVISASSHKCSSTRLKQHAKPEVE